VDRAAIDPPATSNDRTFRRLLALGLALCLALYAEEAIHFLRYGWNSADNDPATRSLANCRPVPGSATDLECPVRGYGMARYRGPDPKESPPRHLVFIDRLQ
jgi:hypothetical protein